MSKLFAKIKKLVVQGCYVVGLHASERLEERGILEWQVVAGLEEGELLKENVKARPNPKIEVQEILPDGLPCKAIWPYLGDNDVAKLVTVHFFDEEFQ
jgi:hypothetical protein